MEAPPGSFDAITAGEAFHRFDQPIIGAKARSWLTPSGLFVVLWCDAVWEGTEPWQSLLREIMERWEPPSAAARHPRAAPPEAGIGRVLGDAGFLDKGEFEFRISHAWDADSILGNLYSTSVFSKHALGPDAAAFETDLRRGLLSTYPENNFPQTVRFFYTLAGLATE